MEAETSSLARRVAARVADELDPALPSALERELAAQGREEVRTTHRSLTFDAGTTIALAAFLLSVVQFGWQVWRDLKKDREEARDGTEKSLATPPRKLHLRRLRLGLAPPPGLAPGRRDLILEAVVNEIVGIEDAGP